MPHPLTGRDILFTRQSHDAKRAGFHYDYRLVLGSHAYSWATKKELPEPGKSIILYEQPVHSRDYALRKRVVIPEGNYGHGITTLDWVRKAKVEPETEDGKIVMISGNEKFLLKKLNQEKYGPTSWLFKNLSSIEKKANMTNKYLTKLSNLFYPHLDKTEFDLAFEGEGNPNRERIKNVAMLKNREDYLNALRSWKNDAKYVDQDEYSTYDYTDHMAKMPIEDEFNHLRDLEGDHYELAAKSGKAVPGPNKVGLGIGYGLGVAGLAGGLVARNPVLAIGGGLATLGTGIYHNQTQPEKRYNRFLDRATELNERKQYLLDLAGEG